MIVFFLGSEYIGIILPLVSNVRKIWTKHNNFFRPIFPYNWDRREYWY